MGKLPNEKRRRRRQLYWEKEVFVDPSYFSKQGKGGRLRTRKRCARGGVNYHTGICENFSHYKLISLGSLLVEKNAARQQSVMPKSILIELEYLEQYPKNLQ